jgi:hypothetical protein
VARLFLFSLGDDEMSQKLFRAAAMALWGSQYRSEAVRQLGLALRTVMRWDAGKTSIPQSAWEGLAELLIKRKKRIDRVLAKLPVSL